MVLSIYLKYNEHKVLTIIYWYHGNNLIWLFHSRVQLVSTTIQSIKHKHHSIITVKLFHKGQYKLFIIISYKMLRMANNRPHGYCSSIIFLHLFIVMKDYNCKIYYKIFDSSSMALLVLF